MGKQKKVRIERKYLPLFQLQKEQGIGEILETASGQNEILLRRLKCSRRTFQQVVELFDGYGMSDETQMWILRKLHVMDVENPVNLEDVCGYLKDENWKVDLVDLGYYRVEIHWDKGGCRTVRRVIKSGGESKGEMEEELRITFETDCGKCVLAFESACEFQEFWKELLLTGKSRGGREVICTLYGTEE